MSNRTIFTIGYSQKNAATTLLERTKQGVTILDIRLKPVCRWNPQFDKKWLQRTFEHYHHIPELGNLHYRGGDVLLADIKLGMAKALSFLETEDILLLCACREWRDCHRHTVSTLLLNHDHTLSVVHLMEDHEVYEDWHNGEIVMRRKMPMKNNMETLLPESVFKQEYLAEFLGEQG